MHRNRHPFSSRPRKGFALLITITLLAFLVLLLVSLASLTRVETQVANNSQQVAQARQNAIMAMNIALGRLQQLAGPDARVTGTAELVAGADASKQKWTGVWKWDSASPSNPAWLVSTANSASALGSANVTTPPPATGTVTLVGDGSTDISIIGNEVKVETQPITAAAPGFPGAQTIGNFAYWVGDEGVKSKVSLVDPWESPTPATKTATGVDDASAAIYRFVSAQRSGIEGVSSNGAAASTSNKLGAAYPATDTTFKNALTKAVSLRQLPLTNSAGQSELSAAVRNRFHDLTASSFSVLSNTSSGGLKRDLTTWLAKPASAANLPLDSTLIASPAITGDSTVYPSAFLPKWGLFRSYAGLRSGAAVAPQFQTDTQQGVHPVITYARMGYNVSRPDAASPVQFHLFPVVVLWNPYNVPISATNYKFKFDYINTYATIKIASGSAANRAAAEAAGPVAVLQLFKQQTQGIGAPAAYPFTTTGNTPITFPLECPEIPAGQSLVFTLTTTAPYVINTNKLGAHNPSRQDNCVTLQGPVIADTDLPADKTVWFIKNFGNLGLSLTDTSDQPFHLLQNIGTYSIFRSSPVNTKATLPTDAFTAKVYTRVENYLSEGAHGGSGLMPRWLAQLNPAAALSLRKPRDNAQGGQNGLSVYMDVQGLTNSIPLLPTNRASMGAGADVSAASSSTTTDLVLQEFQPPGTPLFSIAQLQHAGLSLLNLYPVYAVGNSLPNVYVASDRDRTDALPNTGIVPGQVPRLYDLSYLLNKALWDDYFFSTVPASLNNPAMLTEDYRLPNARHTLYWRNTPAANGALEFTELTTSQSTAAHLLINGGFNVNSTSMQAWRALLYAHNNVVQDTNPDYKHPFSRYTNSPDGTSNTNVWRGYRILSDKQLDNLAVKIAAEVKARGPFTSLGDFVNRRLKNDATGLKGTLQAAIDAVDADPAIAITADRINHRDPFVLAATRMNQSPSASTISTDPYKIYPDNWVGNKAPSTATFTYNVLTTGTTYVDVVQPAYGTALAQPSSSRAAFAPGFLTQADLLSSLGPVLSARSDTFVIRAYGDVQNPATSNIDAKAWCEAVVQRLPDYIEPTIDPWATPAANTTNDKFGRRFRIVSFRWLSAGEI